MNTEKTINGKETRNNFFLSLLKGSLMALSISLILICIFAFLLRFCDIKTEAIKPINQVIKIVSILIGAFYGLKKSTEMGLITGLFIGLVYTILAFVVFSVLNGGFNFERSLINDIIFGGIAGAIAGVIAVNFKKKK